MNDAAFMPSLTIHYVHDPLCGWCYAAAPLVKAISAAGVALRLHGGGLWDRPLRPPTAMRQQIRQADERIRQLTGQVFGAPYLDRLLADPALVFNSRPPTAAVLAAGQLDREKELAMAQAIQNAHYVDGVHVVDPAVLSGLAAALGLNVAAFTGLLDTVNVDRHIDETRDLMNRHGLRGFPAFLMERDGVFSRIDHESFYGKPDAFAGLVRDMIKGC